MHGFKRLTIVALSLWASGALVSAAVPWDAVEAGRASIETIQPVGDLAKRTAKSPKILLVGSSPVVLGLSAKRIESATGLPTFNLGVFGALTFFPEYLEKVEALVQPGDIVVVSNPNWIHSLDAKLPTGCISSFRLACLRWRPRPMPHLIEVIRVLSGRLAVDPGVVRDGAGDAVVVRSANTAATIPPLPFDGSISDEASAEVRQTVEVLRAKGACPVIALGPILVDPREREKWLKEQSATEARIAKLGLANATISEGLVNTDRGLFLDTYEHPAASERAAWTDRVIQRLVSKYQSPCAGSMAKAVVSGQPS